MAGADDFISSHISSHELVARIMSKVCWHRQLKTSVPFDGIKLGNLTLDENRFKVLINKLPIKLTFFEYNLLRYLLIKKDFVVSRSKILNDIWKENTVCPRTVDTHLYFLRKKLKHFDHEIITIHNAGYTLRARPTEMNTNQLLPCIS